MSTINVFSLSAKIFIFIDLIEAKGAVGGGRTSVRGGFYGGVYPRTGGGDDWFRILFLLVFFLLIIYFFWYYKLNSSEELSEEERILKKYEDIRERILKKKPDNNRKLFLQNLRPILTQSTSQIQENLPHSPRVKTNDRETETENPDIKIDRFPTNPIMLHQAGNSSSSPLAIPLPCPLDAKSISNSDLYQSTKNSPTDTNYQSEKVGSPDFPTIPPPDYLTACLDSNEGSEI